MMGVSMRSSKPWMRVPAGPSRIPTMISGEERRYLHWLTATRWVDAGHVVEIGPWLGGSTSCLAEGMEAGARKRHRLFAVDNFVWRPFMAERARLDLVPGDSFESVFRANVAAFGDRVVCVRASLPDEAVAGDAFREETRDEGSAPLFRWDPDEPIEVLFVDGAKSWKAMLHLLAETADSLVGGRALVVCQDYKYWGAYWVIIAIELLSEQLECLDIVGANTVTFRLRGRLRRSDVEQLPRLEELGVDAGLAALESASRRLAAQGDAAGAAIVRLARVRFLGHLGHLEAAISAFRESERGWPSRGGDRNLSSAHSWLERFAGTPIPRTVPGRGRATLRSAVRAARRLSSEAIALLRNAR